VVCHVSRWPSTVWSCALGQQRMVMVLTRCGLSLPTYFLADEKHSYCLTAKVYLPRLSGRVIWHLGYTEEAVPRPFTQSYGVFQCAASQQDPTIGSGDSDRWLRQHTRSMRSSSGSALGHCLRHAINNSRRNSRPSRPVRKAWARSFTPCCTSTAAQELAGFALGSGSAILRHVTHTAGTANGARVRRWLRTRSGLVWRSSKTRRCQSQHLLDQAISHRTEIVRDERVSPPRRKQQAFLGTSTPVQLSYHVVHARRPMLWKSKAGSPTSDWLLICVRTRRMV